MSKQNSPPVLAFYVFLCFIIFLIDIPIPLGIPVWLLFLIPIFGIYKNENINQILIITTLTSILSITDQFLSPVLFKPEYFTMIGRAIGLFVLWIFAFVLINRLNFEKKLKESEEQFRLTFELAAFGFVHIHPDGSWLRFNDKFCEMMGYSREELEHLTFKDITHPDDLEADLKNREKLLLGEIGSFKMEKRYIRKEGSIIWVILTCSLYYIPGSDSVYFISVIEDITERKLLEEELLKEKKYAEELSDFNLEILETSPYGVAVYDTEGNCTYANEALCRIIGATRTQALLQNFYEISSWKNSGMYELAVRALRTGILQTNQFNHITTFGKDIQVEAKFIPFKAFEKTSLLLMLNDITNYKKIEKELKENKDMLTNIIQTAMDGIMVIDEDLRIKIFNTGCEKIFSSSAEEVIGKTIEQFIPKCYIDEHRENIKHFGLGKNIGWMMGKNGTITGVKSTGEEFPLEASVSQFEVDGRKYYTVVHRDISERKKTEEILKGSEERLRLALSAGRHGLYDFDIQKHEAIVDEEYESILGYKPGELHVTYDWWVDQIHPEDRQYTTSILNDCIIGKSQNYKMEFRMRAKSTAWKWILCQGKNTEYDKSGNPSRMIGTHTDITERKLVEEKVIELNRQLIIRNNEIDMERMKWQGIVEGIAEEVWVCDINGKIDLINLGSMTLMGLKEFTGKSVEEILQDVDIMTTDWKPRPAREAPLLLSLCGEIVRGEEIMRHKQTGVTRYRQFSSAPLRDKEGKITGAVAITRDITRQIENEQKLRETLVQLHESEAKLIEAQRLTHIGSFETELETGKVKWSDEIFNIYDRDIALGEPSFDEALEYVHPEDKGRVWELVLKGTEIGKPFEFDYRIIINDKTKYIHYIGKPVYDNTGKVIKRAGVIVDVTDRKLAQSKLEDTLINLQRSNKDLEQFAYTVSHDLQEPIRMMKNYSELLLRRSKDKLDNDELEFLGFISEGANRMNQLVSDLLKYSRIATKAQPFEEVDCNEILKEVLDDLRFKIQETNALISNDMLPQVNADRTQLRQVFQNLIHNALKFKKDKVPEIDIRSERRNEVWLFSVKDNGIGMEQQHFNRIFEIFQRLHTRDEYPGTGIGLALVKKIIERHKGEVCVESIPGKGSVFYFTLPID